MNVDRASGVTRFIGSASVKGSIDPSKVIVLIDGHPAEAGADPTAAPAGRYAAIVITEAGHTADGRQTVDFQSRR